MYAKFFPKRDFPLFTSNPETIVNILVNNRLAKQKLTLMQAKMISHYTNDKQQAI